MPTILEIEARGDMSAAASDMADLGGAARDLGADLDVASSAAQGFDASGVADGADTVASKSSQATGALGALAGGLEAVGLEKYAAGLQGASIATDVMSGAGDALNLVADTAAGKWLLNTGRTVAHAVATGAQTVATGAQTAAQGALNAVMAANPILLVVIAVAALVGGLILAYKHSETFRNIVDGAFTRAKDVVTGAVDAVRDFLDWLGDLPGQARDAWEGVRSAVVDKVGAAKEFFGDFISDVKRLPREAASTVAGFFSDMFAPIETAIDWVEDLIDLVKDIDFPDFPDIPFLGRAATPTTSTPDNLRPNLTITINGALDPASVARQILELLDDYAQLSVVPAWSDLP